MKQSLRLMGCCAVFSLLAACSILPEAENPDVYRLPATPASASRASAVDWSLRVITPKASLALDRPRIAVVPEGNLLSSYQDARWSNPAPVLLRDRLVDAFLADGRVKELSSDDYNLQADLELAGDLRAFQSEYRGGKPEIVIRLDARLVQAATQRIVAVRSFSVTQPVDGSQVPQVVEAFGKAGDQLAAQVVDWTIQQGQARKPAL
ncbi:ABC-type transport auxiliary lipoprotein family protein [Pseudomonas schmalbachii]|uniref:Membrane integrity-associated transporter subunit PqiC n=1 Tax=Pseudomonas schmalbachii TaxID=2816993 RepID=A0ABS3TS09_9PSED|nr:ABC-type transport auxiliary lipoprotein family protein [Pseudomonas schmalbachii]MBO3276445.1 membrane integrity-associated transporter subunit PqiC [Pseudomonas schmalbachii]